MNREHEIEEILASTRHMEKADPGPFFAEKVMSRLAKDDEKEANASPAIKWSLAFAVGAMILINATVIRSVNRPERNDQNVTENTTYIYTNDLTLYEY